MGFWEFITGQENSGPQGKRSSEPMTPGESRALASHEERMSRAKARGAGPRGKSAGSAGGSFGVSDLIKGLFESGDTSVAASILAEQLSMSPGSLTGRDKTLDTIRSLSSNRSDALYREGRGGVRGRQRGSTGGPMNLMPQGRSNPDPGSWYEKMLRGNFMRGNERKQEMLDREMELNFDKRRMKELMGMLGNGGRQDREVRNYQQMVNNAGKWEPRDMRETVSRDRTLDILRMFL